VRSPAALVERAGMAAARAGIRPTFAPTPLFDTYYAVMSARVVMAATSLGVIAALAERDDDAAGLAERLRLQSAGLDALLYALHTLGYVRARGGGRYALTRTARRWLAPGGLDAVVGAFNYDSWQHFGRLEDVLSGAPPVGLHERDPADPYWGRYQEAMGQFAALSAGPVARAIRVRSPRRLLDLGGGPGVHAAAMCARHPQLEATVVELEGAARLARPHERVTYLTGDLFTTGLGTGYDVVTAHSVLHNLPPERCRELIRRAHAATAPGGTFAALELERAPAGRAGTQIGALTGVLFWVLQHSRTYTAAEMRGWLAAAGFTRIRAKRPPALAGSVLLLATA
jgi:hypothetical protein